MLLIVILNLKILILIEPFPILVFLARLRVQTPRSSLKNDIRSVAAVLCTRTRAGRGPLSGILDAFSIQHLCLIGGLGTCVISLLQNFILNSRITNQFADGEGCIYETVGQWSTLKFEPTGLLGTRKVPPNVIKNRFKI